VDCGCIVFLRLPEKGKVKTRLAATVGQAEALKIYTQLTALTLDLVSRLDIPVYLFYEGGLPVDRNPGFHYYVQAEGNLGSKMESAIDLILRKHKMAIIIGSDCPDLSLQDIDESMHQLEKNDFVIGPAADGGIYLFGCKEILPGIFENIPWSTAEVKEAIVHAIEKQGKSHYHLRTLHDIDLEEDWARYMKANP